MTTLNLALDRADACADNGDITGACAILEASRRELLAEGLPVEACQLQVELGAMTARAGDLTSALAILEVAEASAHQAGSATLALEARVTHCSVLGAMGAFDQAIPALTHAVKRLAELAPDSELYADARAELTSFTNLTSPKNAATWAALLDS
ncbi:MAG: hypothetical protein KC912_05880 [Proteobacteria bacterium]|nr:hypothetical protein [Pseudomonadota bacterium]